MVPSITLPDADDRSGAEVPGGSGHIENFQIKTNATSTNLAAAAGVDATMAPKKSAECDYNGMKKNGRLTDLGGLEARKELISAVEHGEADDVALNGVAERWSLHPEDVAKLRKQAAFSFVFRNEDPVDDLDTSGLTDPLFITEVEKTRNELAQRSKRKVVPEMTESSASQLPSDAPNRSGNPGEESPKTRDADPAAAAGVDTTVAPEKVLERFFNKMKKDGRLTYNGWVNARKELISAVERGEAHDVALNGVAERWSLHPDDVAALRKEAARSFVSRNMNKVVKGDGNWNIVDTSGLTDPLFITEVEKTRNEWAR
jgi:hypothetical protein